MDAVDQEEEEAAKDREIWTSAGNTSFQRRNNEYMSTATSSSENVAAGRLASLGGSDDWTWRPSDLIHPAAPVPATGGDWGRRVSPQEGFRYVSNLLLRQPVQHALCATKRLHCCCCVTAQGLDAYTCSVCA